MAVTIENLIKKKINRRLNTIKNKSKKLRLSMSSNHRSKYVGVLMLASAFGI
jgi:hypothetical protein